MAGEKKQDTPDGEAKERKARLLSQSEPSQPKRGASDISDGEAEGVGWKKRYLRQIRFPKIGEAGQKAFAAGRVAIVGCGALGSAIAEFLVRAGVGYLRLIDRDIVEESNLPRQMLYTEEDAVASRPKVEAARMRLLQINPRATIDGFFDDLRPGKAEDRLAKVDLILDGTDNLETRYLLNDLCTKEQRPWIYGACVGSHGQVMLCHPPATACFRCLFPEGLPAEATQTCETTGIFNPLPAAVASLQASLALRWLIEPADALEEGLWHIDLWPFSFFGLPPPPLRASCPCCQEKRWPYLEGQRSQQIQILCGQEGLQLRPAKPCELPLPRLAEALASEGAILVTDLFLRFQTQEWICFFFQDGRALFRGAIDAMQARSFYAKLTGL